MAKSAKVLEFVRYAKDMHNIGMAFLLFSRRATTGPILRQQCVAKAQDYFLHAHALMARAKEMHKADA